MDADIGNAIRRICLFPVLTRRFKGLFKLLIQRRKGSKLGAEPV